MSAPTLDAVDLRRAWAFCGIAEVGRAVHAEAQGIEVPHALARELESALLAQNPDSFTALTTHCDLRGGMRQTRRMLARPDADELQALRYVLAILDATGQLRAQPPVVARLGDALEEISASGRQDSVPFETLAAVYVRTLGTLDQRIQVRGAPGTLQRPEVAARIRTLLLMGVRFAWLWHQYGGRRWHLLLFRKRIRQAVERLESALGAHAAERPLH
ncbi:MAG: DUF489 family protein [Pseudomonadota bacterium]